MVYPALSVSSCTVQAKLFIVRLGSRSGELGDNGTGKIPAEAPPNATPGPDPGPQSGHAQNLLLTSKSTA